MALLDTQVAMLANLGANYLVSGAVPGRMGNAHQNIVPYQVFEVAPAADDTNLKRADEAARSEGVTRPARDHIIIAVGNDSQFRKFCNVADVPELGVDPLFALNRDRVKNRAQLVPMLEAVMRSKSKADWLVALEAAKVPCGAINNLAEVFADPHIRSRGMVTHWQHPHQNDLRLVSSPIKLSATPVRSDMPPPLLGQHTDDVLRSVLNYPDAKLSDLKNNKVI
jgi:crotonobetainyl-CoA:carnitine CoA-transferase CaiB-like acyl-CoA transferase